MSHLPTRTISVGRDTTWVDLQRRPRVPTRRGGHAAVQLWWLDHQRRFRSEAAVHRRVHGGRGVRSAREYSRQQHVHPSAGAVTCSQSPKLAFPSIPVIVAVPAIDPVTGQTVTLFNQRPETLGNNRQLLTNPSEFETEFDGFEISAQRRFADGYQFLTSYAYSTSDITRTSISVSAFGGEEEGAGGIGFGPSAFLNPNQLINNTSGPGFFDRTHCVQSWRQLRHPKDRRHGRRHREGADRHAVCPNPDAVTRTPAARRSIRVRSRSSPNCATPTGFPR